MTVILRDHTEWAVVDRLGKMLLQTDGGPYDVTQAYALFSGILCWTVQRLRAPDTEIDQIAVAARQLWNVWEHQDIADDPWLIWTDPSDRDVVENGRSFKVPRPVNFEGHTVTRFLENLRNAVAHGDARTVEPFNFDYRLYGFTFRCAEYAGRGQARRQKWAGEMTLTKSDLVHLGSTIATRFCDIVQPGGLDYLDQNFVNEASSMREDAA